MMKLSTVRRYVMSLPQVVEMPHFDYASFRIGGKMIVTVPPADTHIHVFVPEAVREQALVLHPDFIEKLFWGKKVLGLRITLARAQPAVVKALIRRAWELRAPKKLIAQSMKSSDAD